MNAVLHARIAYGAPNAAQRTPRNTEYDAFARATRALTDANAPDATPASRAEALTRNRRLWTVLATDLAGDGNGLPADLRATLLGLAQFVLNHSEQVMAGSETLQPLIDVNMAIMRGLRGEGGG